MAAAGGALLTGLGDAPNAILSATSTLNRILGISRQFVATGETVDAPSIAADADVNGGSPAMDKLRVPDLTSINRGLRVMLIEDSDIDSRLIMDLLRKDKRVEDVIHVERAEPAISLLSDGAEPDLVIADLGLPGKSGIEFLVELRQLENASAAAMAGPTEHLPVVVLTDSDRAIDFHSATLAEANTFITKPDDHAELRALLRQVIRAVIQEPELPNFLAPGTSSSSSTPSAIPAA